MKRNLYRYELSDNVPIEDVEASLLLAILAVESIHGESQVRMDAGHVFDAELRKCVIDGRTEVGRDLNRLFTGFLIREFGDNAFTVKRVEADAVEHGQAA